MGTFQNRDIKHSEWLNSKISPGFLVEIQKGNVPGHDLVHKFGRNPSIPMNDWAFVTDLGNSDWYGLDTAAAVRIKAGGNVADDAAGAGLRSAVVSGILDTGVEDSETLVTAGASASALTSKSFYRVFRVEGDDVGTKGGANTGQIIIEDSTGTYDLCSIPTGEGQSQHCAFTIPQGFSGFLVSLHTHVASTKVAKVRLRTREAITTAGPPFKCARTRLFFDGVAESLGFKEYSPGSRIPELTDIWVEAYGDGGTAEVSAEMEILLVSNEGISGG